MHFALDLLCKGSQLARVVCRGVGGLGKAGGELGCGGGGHDGQRVCGDAGVRVVLPDLQGTHVLGDDGEGLGGGDVVEKAVGAEHDDVAGAQLEGGGVGVARVVENVLGGAGALAGLVGAQGGGQHGELERGVERVDLGLGGVGDAAGAEDGVAGVAEVGGVQGAGGGREHGDAGGGPAGLDGALGQDVAVGLVEQRARRRQRVRVRGDVRGEQGLHAVTQGLRERAGVDAYFGPAADAVCDRERHAARVAVRRGVEVRVLAGLRARERAGAVRRGRFGGALGLPSFFGAVGLSDGVGEAQLGRHRREQAACGGDEDWTRRTCEPGYAEHCVVVVKVGVKVCLGSVGKISGIVMLGGGRFFGLRDEM